MYQHPKYPKLFSPLLINKLVLKNRIFYAPVEAYLDRARAGAAVMMRGTSGTLNDPRCRISPGKWLFSDPLEVRRIKEEVMILKRAGSLTSLEVMHAGIWAKVPAGDYVVGPSDGRRDDGVEIRGMDREMMQQVIDEFVETTVIARKVGFDMVMLHFAHGWLPSQFLAPAFNKRTDEFGGSIENRFRFPKMILKNVRQALGPNYAIDMRISATEDFEGCAPAEEIVRFIKEVAEEGFIDMVNISYGGHLSPNKSMINSPSAFEPDMTFTDYSKAVKDVVSIPVSVVGKIMTPEEAEQVLEEGKADAVVIGRASIADPWWAEKALNCDSEDIIPCIMCGRCFEKRCTVQLRNYNYDIVPLELQKSKDPKKIVIVGGGPAGMRAAITASQKGHEVVLFEATSELGGLIKVSEYDEYKRHLKYYKDYLINQMKKSNVKVRLNTKATPEIVAAEKPDQLILAMGSLPVTPKIKGVEYAHQIIDIYSRIDEIGKKVVIIGGGLVGSELAASLAIKNHDVTIVEMTADIARDDVNTFKLRDYLEGMQNVTLMPETNCREITRNSVIVAGKDGIEKEIQTDIVILCVGFRSNNENITPFFSITPKVSMIGDLRRPATIRECEEEGFFSVSET